MSLPLCSIISNKGEAIKFEILRKGETMAKIGRNAPCPCGSGRKYKKCCLRKDEEAQRQKPISEYQANEKAFGDLEDDKDEAGWRETEDSWPFEDENEGADSDYSGAEDSIYPQIDKSIPAISESEQAIADEWWEGFSPVYRDRDADEMIRRIVGFMEEHPNLFVHLYLNEECLFELGAELERRGENNRYVELLQRIRKERPEVFIRSYGYYDRDIITELILSGQREEICQYFNFYREYPDSYPDELSEIIDLLLAANCQEELVELIQATAIPVTCSSKVMGGDFALRWFIFEQWIPFLEKRDASESSCNALLAALNNLELPFDPGFDSDLIQLALTVAFDKVSEWDITQCRKQKDFKALYGNICWNFCSLLNEKKGMSWTTARFFADRIEEYFYDIPPGKRPKKAFDFNKKRLDQHIAESCMRIMYPNGVLAISLLQSVYYFAGYLKENLVFSAEDMNSARQVCLSLFETCKKALSASDAGPIMFSTFPNYQWAI